MSLQYFFLIVSLVLLEVFYFRVADKFNIIDKPNARSSHTQITIRGGGIIFAIAPLFFFFLFNFQFIYFIIGLIAISLISFLDDILTLNNKVRLTVHILAVFLLFRQWNLFDFNWYWLLIAGIFVIATINAYNFMDGINGITGSYSLLVICSLYYINEWVVAFTSSEFIIITGLSLLVFNFFNFRKVAKCFAGDVGSVSIAFIVVFLIGQLILKTQNFSYILLLLCYGLDTVFTIGFRLIRKENIFKAHRSHFYQHLSNERKWSHLKVSVLYFILQLFINLLIIFFIKNSLLMALALVLLCGVLFLIARFLLEGNKRLLKEAE